MTLAGRVLGALRLDAAMFEEVEADHSATPQALAIILLSALATGLGNLADGGWRGLLAGAIGALVGWVLWAAVIWQVGTRLLPEAETSADLGELLRTLGFAASPSLLRVAGLLPGAGMAVGVVTTLWMVAATVIAVRQALDYRSTLRAVVVCLVGAVGYIAAAVVVALALGLGSGLVQFHGAEP